MVKHTQAIRRQMDAPKKKTFKKPSFIGAKKQVPLKTNFYLSFSCTWKKVNKENDL